MRTQALLTGFVILCASCQVSAQQVTLAGILGSKALMVINNGAPRSFAVGESFGGVKLVVLQGDQAEIDIAGKRRLLRMGEASSSADATAGPPSDGKKIVLTVGSGGHFHADGLINGRSVPLMVDTGATYVSLSEAEATRIGLNYKTGQAARVNTANGIIPSWRIKLDSLRLGDVVVYNVDAMVSSGAMPYVLLGNSFLGRFQMTRNNDQMVLDKRF